MKEICRWIDKFDKVKEFFLCGACYWFAIMLQKRFGGDIYYLPIANHFLIKINGTFYDAGGVAIPTEEAYPWTSYKYRDEIETKRIVRDCINMED